MCQSQGSSYGPWNCLSSPECCCHWRVLWRTNSWRRRHIGSYRIIGGVQDHLPLMFWDTGALLSRMSGRKCRGKPISTHSLRFSWRQPWGRLPYVLDRNKKGNMCVCVSVCIYAYIYMRICVHLYYVCIYMCACMHTCCVSILCVHVYMNVCEYVCIYTNKMYIFVCAYTDIFIIYTNKTEGLMLVWIETRTSSTLFFAFFFCTM